MAGGDYGQRVTASSSDEVGDLARAFNAMSADLASADQQRRQLVATVSHELRTPLTAQRALLENLVDGVVRPDDEALRGGPDPVRAAQRPRRRPARPLAHRRRRRAAGPHRRAGRRAARRRGVGGAGRRAGGAGASTTCSPPTSPCGADPARLAQLVANLVDNAVRHSPPEGEVRVVARGPTTTRGGSRCATRAPASPPTGRSGVFDRFGSGGDSAGGTGLGLAIASWVCELHGGSVAALPTAPGATGARPARGAAPAARRRRPTHPPHPGEHDEPTAQPRHDPGRRAPTLPRSARSPPPPRRRGPPVRPAAAERSTRSGRRRACPAQPLTVLAALGVGALGGAHLAGAQRRASPSA